tara:strand:+ start:291 stop:740 length:450 start_codon:yes stop_codon:yes gene_type:complete
MKITPKYIDKVRDKLQSIINKEKLDVNIKFGNATYDDDTFTIKLKVSLPNAKSDEEKALDVELRTRQVNKSWMKPLDQTKIHSLGKVKYTLCGYRPKARAKPFIVLNLLDKKKYLISEEQAEKFFGDPNWKNTMDYKVKDFVPRQKKKA